MYLERLVFQVKYGADLVSVLKKGNQIFERLGMPKGRRGYVNRCVNDTGGDLLSR